MHGFEPYFYVEAPPAFGPDDCDSLRALLNVSFFTLHLSVTNVFVRFCLTSTECGDVLLLTAEMYRAVQSRLLEQSKGSGSKLCVAVRLEQKQTAMHFQSAKHRQFLKIVLATPTLVTKARGQPLS